MKSTVRISPASGAMSCGWLLVWLASVTATFADTTITISTNIAVSGVKRFGINLAQVNYYDSGQLLKELVFRNPGFEGQMWQSVVRVGSGTATSAVEDGAPLAELKIPMRDSCSVPFDRV